MGVRTFQANDARKGLSLELMITWPITRVSHTTRDIETRLVPAISVSAFYQLSGNGSAQAACDGNANDGSMYVCVSRSEIRLYGDYQVEGGHEASG